MRDISVFSWAQIDWENPRIPVFKSTACVRCQRYYDDMMDWPNRKDGTYIVDDGVLENTLYPTKSIIKFHPDQADAYNIMVKWVEYQKTLYPNLEISLLNSIS